MTRFGRIFAAAAAVIATLTASAMLSGCFKKVSNDTVFLIKANLQAESGGELVIAEGAVARAWFNRSTLWSVESYDDALAGVLTDTENGKVETAAPDAESAAEPDGDGGGRLRIETRSASVLLAVLYPQARMLAWRVFETAENMSPTYLTVQFRPWRNDNYIDSGWNIVVQPKEQEQEQESDDQQ